MLGIVYGKAAFNSRLDFGFKMASSEDVQNLKKLSVKRCAVNSKTAVGFPESCFVDRAADYAVIASCGQLLSHVPQSTQSPSITANTPSVSEIASTGQFSLHAPHALHLS
jgi:hypothetical protein